MSASKQAILDQYKIVERGLSLLGEMIDQSHTALGPPEVVPPKTEDPEPKTLGGETKGPPPDRDPGQPGG